MDELKCMLGEYKSQNADCAASSECRHCGHEIHEADRRERKIHAHGLTQREDGLRGLVIRQ